MAPGVQPCCRSFHPLSLRAPARAGSARKGWLGLHCHLGLVLPGVPGEVLRYLCKNGLVEYITLKREGKPVGKKHAAESLWLVAAWFFWLWKCWNYTPASSVCVPGVMEPVSGGSFFVL